MTRILFFIFFFGFILVGMPLYVGRRLIHPLGLPRRWNLLAWGFLELVVLATPFMMGISTRTPGKMVDFALGASHLGFGLFILLFFYTVVRDLAWAPVRFLVLRDEELRRLWLRRTSLAVIGVAVLSLTIGMFQALGTPVVRRVIIPIAGLHPDLEGLRIVQLSDIHLSPWKDRDDLERIVAQTNSLEPEIVVITGDLVDGSVTQRGDDATPLADLSAPAYFVTGNHDNYSGAAQWVQHLRRLGVDVLDGVTRTVKRGEATVLLAGLADPTVGNEDARFRNPGVLLRGDQPADVKILLAHRSSDAYTAVKAGFDLQLSGHTHGGQFFPGTLLIHWIQPFATGLYRHEGMWIYTSQGTGFWGPPVRFLNPPEIIVLTLERAST